MTKRENSPLAFSCLSLEFKEPALLLFTLISYERVLLLSLLRSLLSSVADVEFLEDGSCSGSLSFFYFTVQEKNDSLFGHDRKDGS